MLPDEQPNRQQARRRQVDEHILSHGGDQSRNVLRIDKHVADDLNCEHKRQQGQQAEAGQVTKEHTQRDHEVGCDQEPDIDIARSGPAKDDRKMRPADGSVCFNIRELIQQQQVADQEERHQRGDESLHRISPRQGKMRTHHHERSKPKARRQQAQDRILYNPYGVSIKQEETGNPDGQRSPAMNDGEHNTDQGCHGKSCPGKCERLGCEFGMRLQRATAAAERRPLGVVIQSGSEVEILIEHVHADVCRDRADQSQGKVPPVDTPGCPVRSPQSHQRASWGQNKKGQAHRPQH